MSAAGYTTIYNEVLRDRTLSLEAKGLFAVIKSFVGLPDFALSKRRLGYACLGQRLPAECGVEGAQAKGIPAALFLPGGKWCVLSCLQPDAAPVRAGGLRLFPVHRPPER